MQGCLMGRLFTLGMYMLRYSVRMVHRPDSFVVLNQPVSRMDKRHLLVR